jgi:hypothetical protein
VGMDRIEGAGPPADPLGAGLSVGQTLPIARAAGGQVKGSPKPTEGKAKRHRPDVSPDESLDVPEALPLQSTANTAERDAKNKDGDAGTEAAQTSHCVDNLV